MGWFEEQIKTRKDHDDKVFCESIASVADAVMGYSAKAGVDRRIQTKNAIDEILKFYGCNARELPASIEDSNEAIEYLCRPHGIMSRPVNLTPGWYKNAVGAFLATRKDDDALIALIPNKMYGYGYKDENGKIVNITKKNEGMFETEAYSFYKPLPLRKLTPFDLFKYAFESRSISDIVTVLGFMGLSTLIGLLVPKITFFLYDTVAKGAPHGDSLVLLISTIFFLICVSVSNSLFSTFNNMVNEKINRKMELSVQSATMMRILSLPPSFFRNYSSGELSNRQTYISQLASELINMIFHTGFSSLFSLAYITSIFSYAPSLVVPALIMTLATVIFTIVSSLVQINISKKKMEIASKQSGIAYSILSGVQKIKLAGAEKRAFSRWAKLFAEQAQLEYNPPMFIKLNGVIAVAIGYIGTVIMYAAAIKNGVSVAEYTAFDAAYGMVVSAFMSTATVALTIAQLKPTIEMAKPILDAVPEISEGKEVVTSVNGSIELSHISFRYAENMPLVIDDLSLKIGSGQYVAIVGRTGCGKSTLVRLLLGFEQPQIGQIYYDGKDIGKLDLKSLRRKMGVVMQDGQLLMGDIFSNITVTAPRLTLDDAWEAAEIAGIADDIHNMPMGMFTMVAEGQGGISGGQKQRLMIARAVAGKPKILIFDEATSALDNITQRKVSEALDKLNCTRIVIAHRLSTIKNCDRIIYIDGGRIVEDGTYDELIALNGEFAKLVERQRLDN